MTDNSKEAYMKFRKKPVVIEAVQWDGENQAKIVLFCSDAYFEPLHDGGLALVIGTLEDGKDEVIAKHVASIGDWIIKGVQGEFYPCKPDIFAATYDVAND
jgi:hypothetical protein